MKFFGWLKENFPILFSPQFQGIVLTALFQLALSEGWMNANWAEFFRNVIGAGTIVGATYKGIKKSQE